MPESIFKKRTDQINETVSAAQSGTKQVETPIDRLTRLHKQDPERARNLAAGLRAVQVDAGTPGAKPLTNREKRRLRKVSR